MRQNLRIPVKFKIKHEIKGRIRVHLMMARMSIKQADILEYYLTSKEGITSVKIYERTCDAAICYKGKRETVIDVLQKFSYDEAEETVPDFVWENSSRQSGREYWDKLVQKMSYHITRRWLLPTPIRNTVAICRGMKYIGKGLQSLAKGKIEVSVLDGTAIAVSLLQRDFKTAASIMFLLGVGEILEDWTHKKSVDDLARSMSLNITKVWLRSDGKEVLVDASKIKSGDEIVVHMGNLIPFDGVVIHGDGAVNQASLTGESIPIAKEVGGYVYAGTVLEEGELVIHNLQLPLLSESIRRSKMPG